MSVLSKPYFHDEAAAFAHLESVIWSDGIACPHCGAVGSRVYDLSDVRGRPTVKSPEGAVRYGLKKCGECRQQFTVKVGTVFEHARIPLHKMLQAVYLISSSKKGISAHQLHRTLEITYKSAWFLAHRIREAMQTGDLPLMGSDGGMVEVDETLFCRKPGVPVKRGTAHLNRVMALIDRNTGESRALVVDFSGAKEIGQILEANVSRDAHFMTDEWMTYKALGWNFAAHSTVNHKRGEYVNRENPQIHNNTVEGYFSIFKRGMRGVYQFCGQKHLHRYVAEFNFRYSNRAANGLNDSDRAAKALLGISGKRLTYKSSGQRTEAFA